MKKLILCLIILVIIAVLLAITPLIVGYYFKNIYYQQIAIYQKELLNASSGNNNDIKIEIQSYDLGWRQSTARLKVTATKGEPDAFIIESHIMHGPLVNYQNQLRVGYASISSIIYPPDVLKPFQNKNFNWYVDTFVSLNAETWENHYSLPPLTYESIGKWDGLSGDNIINIKNDTIVKMQNDLVFGKIYAATPGAMIALTVDPITIHYSMTREDVESLSGDAIMSANLPRAKLIEGNHVLLDINAVSLKGNSSLKNEIFHQDSGLSIKSIEFPPMTFIHNIDDFDLSGSVTDVRVNKEFIKQYKKSMAEISNYSPIDFSLLFMPTTKANVKLTFNSDLGAVASNLDLSLLAVPKTGPEFINNLVIDFNIKMPQTLFKKLIEFEAMDMSSRMLPMDQFRRPTPISNNQIDSIVAMLIQKGIIMQDKNDYVLHVKRSGQKINLNNKEMTEDEFMMLSMNIQQETMKILMPPPAMPIPTPGAGLQGQPQPMGGQPQPVMMGPGPQLQPNQSSQSVGGAQPQPQSSVSQPRAAGPQTTNIKSEYHCYWMDSSSGKNVWKLMPDVRDQSQCFKLDSCSGGLGASGGGCYKWSTSVDNPGVSFHP